MFFSCRYSVRNRISLYPPKMVAHNKPFDVLALFIACSLLRNKTKPRNRQLRFGTRSSWHFLFLQIFHHCPCEHETFFADHSTTFLPRTLCPLEVSYKRKRTVKIEIRLKILKIQTIQNGNLENCNTSPLGRRCNILHPTAQAICKIQLIRLQEMRCTKLVAS